jgi:hypothetical protein
MVTDLGERQDEAEGHDRDRAASAGSGSVHCIVRTRGRNRRLRRAFRPRVSVRDFRRHMA